MDGLGNVRALLGAFRVLGFRWMGWGMMLGALRGFWGFGGGFGDIGLLLVTGEPDMADEGFC